MWRSGCTLEAMCHSTGIFKDEKGDTIVSDAEAVRELFGKEKNAKDLKKKSKGLLLNFVTCATRNKNTVPFPEELKQHWSCTDYWPPARHEKTLLDNLIDEFIDNPPFNLEETVKLDPKSLG